MKSLFFLLITGCIIYGTSNNDNTYTYLSPKLKESVDRWKSDSNGCKRIRNDQLFYSIFDSIKIKNINTISGYFGKPNIEIDTADNGIRYIIYEYYFNSFCRNNKVGNEASIIKIGFTKSDSSFYRLVIWDH